MGFGVCINAVFPTALLCLGEGKRTRVTGAFSTSITCLHSSFVVFVRATFKETLTSKHRLASLPLKQDSKCATNIENYKIVVNTLLNYKGVCVRLCFKGGLDFWVWWLIHVYLSIMEFIWKWCRALSRFWSVVCSVQFSHCVSVPFKLFNGQQRTIVHLSTS